MNIPYSLWNGVAPHHDDDNVAMLGSERTIYNDNNCKNDDKKKDDEWQQKQTTMLWISIDDFHYTARKRLNLFVFYANQGFRFDISTLYWLLVSSTTSRIDSSESNFFGKWLGSIGNLQSTPWNVLYRQVFEEKLDIMLYRPTSW